MPETMNIKDQQEQMKAAQEAKIAEDKKKAEKVHELFRIYKDKRETWAQHAQEDREFRLGKQWTDEQVRVLEKRGQSPIVINRVHPAVETAKALITANRPNFKISPREDSDVKMANVLSNLLTYIYDISDGRTAIRQVVDDYYVTGLGYLMCYQDPIADYNRGEVKIKDLDPMDVFVDPNSRDRYFNDAESIIVSRKFSKAQAKKLYPMFSQVIENSDGDQADSYPITERTDDGEVQFPSDVGEVAEDTYIRGYEMYRKKMENEWKCYEKWSGREWNHTNEDYKQYLETPAFLIGYEGQNPQEMTVVTDEKQAGKIIMGMRAKDAEAYQQILNEDYEAYLHAEAIMIDEGLPTEAMPNGGKYIPPIESKEDRLPSMEKTTYGALVQMGHLQCVQVRVPRIELTVVIGDDLLYQRILPIEDYPIVPFVNLHTRTPYPVSDVRMIKNLQQYINKTRSLIVAHATTSTNVKILVPEGSVDMKEFEEKWAQPGVAIPVDMDSGAPVPVQPVPLPNELYKNEMDAKQDIDHQLGLYEMMMGNTAAAPQTYKATISLDEFGQRKIKSKLADIEGGLTQVAKVLIPLAQQLYKKEKVFRIVQPNNSMNEFVINKRLYDDKTNEISIFNDLAVGCYDIVLVAGSTLPSNRYAELEFYMDAYAKGLIDRQEVLKKTEVFDAPGVLKRTDDIGKLQQALQQAQETIKKLQGDMQTRDRESVNLRKKVEVEKFGAALDKVKNKAESSNVVFEKRLDDVLATIKKTLDETKKNEKENQSKRDTLNKARKKEKK